MGKIGWGVGGSISLHLVLASVLWPPMPPRTGFSHANLIQVVLVSTSNQPPSPVLTALNKDRPPTKIISSKPVQLQSRPVPDPTVNSNDANINSSDPEPPDKNSTHYLSIHEVDQPAMPLDEWNIDADTLPRGYTLRLVLELWISTSGNLDKWELVESSPNEQIALKAIEHIGKAHIQAALLNNIAVPSFRRLEIVIIRE